MQMCCENAKTQRWAQIINEENPQIKQKLCGMLGLHVQFHINQRQNLSFSASPLMLGTELTALNEALSQGHKYK